MNYDLKIVDLGLTATPKVAGRTLPDPAKEKYQVEIATITMWQSTS